MSLSLSLSLSRLPDDNDGPLPLTPWLSDGTSADAIAVVPDNAVGLAPPVHCGCIGLAVAVVAVAGAAVEVGLFK